MIRIEKITNSFKCCTGCQKSAEKEPICEISIGKQDAKKGTIDGAMTIRLCKNCVNELKYQIELGGLWK